MRRQAIVAAALAVFLALVVPLQSYLGNSELYPVSLLRLLVELGLLAAVLSAVLFAVSRLLGRFLGDGLSCFLTAVIVCVYLETGLLSFGLPEINGAFMPELDSIARGVADVVVWVVVIAGFLALTRKIACWLPHVSMAVLVLGVASLFDVRREGGEDVASESTTDFLAAGERVNQMTVVANVRYSPVRNVLVFILDSMPCTLTTEVVSSDERLRAKFPGFVAYPGNVGMHDSTKFGVPGLMTGRYYYAAEMTKAEYPLTMYGEESFLGTFCKAGWNVAFSPDLLPFGFTTLPIATRVSFDDRRTRDWLAILRRSKEVPYLCLFDLVAFRVAPFFFKGPIAYAKIRHAVRGRHADGDFWSESRMYPTLAAAPSNDDRKPFLGVFHSWGAHPPWAVDQRTTIVAKLEELGKLMETYRARGLYDNSMIVVTADHGNDEAPPPRGYPPSASALLWVKPEGAREPFVVSAAKTTHAKIAALAKAACARKLTVEEIEHLLVAERRLFRGHVGRGKLADFDGEK